MGVSIKDIARAAGVSHATVSRALRDDPRISEHTRLRIQRIAAAMGYSPSAIARGLATGRTDTIGMVVTTISDPFVAPIVQGAEKRAMEAGYSLILSQSGADPDREIAAVRLLRERRVDGVIVTASRVGELYTPLLSELKVPIVLINNQKGGEFLHSIYVDDLAGAKMAVEYLIELGHERIAYVACPERALSNDRRLSGYEAALRSHGIEPPEDFIVQIPGRDDLERGREAIEKLLSMEERPTAVFCYNDLTAIGALQALHLRGVGVPEEVSLVGFDDIPMASMVCPSLTTVAQPKEEMGVKAMEILLALIGGEERDNIVVRPQLVVRGSTAPPA